MEPRSEPGFLCRRSANFQGTSITSNLGLLAARRRSIPVAVTASLLTDAKIDGSALSVLFPDPLFLIGKSPMLVDRSRLKSNQYGLHGIGSINR
jgi:hypothetical protein